MKNLFKFLVIAIAFTSACRAQNPVAISFKPSAFSNGCENQVLFGGQWLRIPFELGEACDSVLIAVELSNPATNSIVELGTYIKSCNEPIGTITATIPENLPEMDGYFLTIKAGDGLLTQFQSGELSFKHMNTWFADFDGDGLGDPAKSFVSVNQSEDGFVQNPHDPDDSVQNSREITGALNVK